MNSVVGSGTSSCRARGRAEGCWADCPTPWLEHAGWCYHIPGREAKNFDWARGVCQDLSLPGRPAQLASVHGEGEAAFVASLAAAFDGEGYWLGLRRVSGGFAWEDGSQLGYIHWRSGEPEAYECVGFYMGSEPGRWATQYCTNPRIPVCKMPIRQP